MNLDVLVVAHFCDEIGRGGNNRFNYLVDKLVAEGADVELITSAFSHTSKSAKLVKPESISHFKVTYIEEPAYQRNVSLARFRAHGAMARRLKRYLASRPRPSVVYCAVPSLAVADAVRAYCVRESVPFVIDVQDLWPEAFYMVSTLGRLNDFLFAPLKRQAERIYRQADTVVAVSDRYRLRALGAGAQDRLSQTLYLGTDLGNFDQVARMSDASQSEKDAVAFVYLGTLGHSYDISIAIHAFKLALERAEIPIKLTVMGDGPLQQRFQALAQELDVPVNFTGRLQYPQMVARLVQCDVALNVISKGAAQSIINKHADYAAAGLPVLSTQECSEYRSLLARFEAGIHCENKSPEDLANAMVKLAETPDLRSIMGAGSRRMAETLFDRARTYDTVMPLLKQVIDKHASQNEKVAG